MKPAALALFALAPFALALGAGSALAETADERSACTPDVWRLCASQIPNVGAITACLRRERPNLSTACRMVMDGPELPVRTVATRR